jgi:hypothetical protein
MLAGNGSSAIYVGQSASRKWNGATWTAGVAPIVPHSNATGVGGGGTPTSALVWGGAVSGTSSNSTEAFNGVSWSVVAPTLSDRRLVYGSAVSATEGLTCGGHSYSSSPTYTNTTESYNGTVWTTRGSMTKARSQHSGGSNSSGSAIVCYNNRTTDTSSEIFIG